MSHAWQHGDFMFVGNSDLSGDILVRNRATEEEIEVPGWVLVAFVAERVRAERITALERMTPEELLGSGSLPTTP